MIQRFKYSIFLLLLLQISISAPGQSHHNLWLRAALSLELNPKFKTDIEYQHRRQNGITNKNCFDHNLMHTLRIWLYYKVDADFQIALSPFSIFENYKLITSIKDQEATPLKEYRVSAAIEYNKDLHYHGISIVNRSAMEYRIFGQSQRNVIRFRNKVGLIFLLQNSLRLMAGDEIIFNTTGVSSNHLFDHNRIFMMLEYRPFTRFKIDAGYIHISRLPNSSLAISEEENFVLNFAYTLVRNRKR